MNNPLISVIIPVYNVENYIERCIDTVVNQSYDNLEIILVDDGATDRSGEICDGYALKDSRIRVIHQPNGGLSAARNAGLDAMTGEYVFFLDSDDYITPDAITILINKMSGGAYDVVACGIEMVWDEDKKEKNRPFTSPVAGEWDGRNSVLEMQKNNTVCSVAWNKLYKSSLWEKIRFPEGRLHEDEYTTYKILFNSERVAYIPDMLYKYYQRSNGINAGATNDDRDDHLKAFYERFLYFKKINDGELMEWSLVKYLEYIKYLYRNARSDKRRNDLKHRYRMNYIRLREYKHVGRRKKLALVLWNYWKY